MNGYRVLNALTIDLEDWAQSVLDPSLPVTDHVVRNTERVLLLLDRCRVRATFFALGRVCEQYPKLLPTIASAGHEIGSHGYGHELIYNISPAHFEADVKKSVELIEAQIGKRPVSYRAPAFSITSRSLWAGPILAKLGFRSSSSIFPIRKRRYGIPEWPTSPSEWPSCKLMEFPLTTLAFIGQRIPTCGGGYMRLWPGCLHAKAISRQNTAGHPAIVYMHPYELASDEVGSFIRSGFKVGWKRRFMQSLWRSRVEPRLCRLLEQFDFGTISEALEAMTVQTQSPSHVLPADVSFDRKTTDHPVLVGT